LIDRGAVRSVAGAVVGPFVYLAASNDGTVLLLLVFFALMAR
jgi:hypothetical protein